MKTAHGAPSRRCLNCGANAPGRFCPECGQETDVRAPQFGEFVKHFTGNCIAVQSPLVQPLWTLVSKPGQLTIDYLAGRRRRHVLPLRLYLAVSFACSLGLRCLLATRGCRGAVP
ncbi:MAG: DUF3667 domain-containing protein [Burkholderiales bacterium]|nr:DUF3667 domain-containing protein [Burkholderiales bacterium]